MLNLVEKFAAEAPSKDDEGVVAIEYVLLAGVVAAGITLVAFTDLWGDLKAELDALFT